MWILIGIGLLIVWAISFFVFKVASWAIHLLIVAAVIAVAIDVFRWIKARV